MNEYINSYIYNHSLDSKTVIQSVVFLMEMLTVMQMM